MNFSSLPPSPLGRDSLCGTKKKSSLWTTTIFRRPVDPGTEGNVLGGAIEESFSLVKAYCRWQKARGRHADKSRTIWQIGTGKWENLSFCSVAWNFWTFEEKIKAITLILNWQNTIRQKGRPRWKSLRSTFSSENESLWRRPRTNQQPIKRYFFLRNQKRAV